MNVAVCDGVRFEFFVSVAQYIGCIERVNVVIVQLFCVCDIYCTFCVYGTFICIT